jgi:hypothetical protein
MCGLHFISEELQRCSTMLICDTKRADVCTCLPDHATDCLCHGEEMKVVSDWYRGREGQVSWKRSCWRSCWSWPGLGCIYVTVTAAMRDGTLHPHKRDHPTAGEYNWQVMPRLRWIFAEPSPLRSGFNPGQSRWDLLTTKWQLGQIFLRVLRVSLASIISLMLHIHWLIHHWYY